MSKLEDLRPNASVKGILDPGLKEAVRTAAEHDHRSIANMVGVTSANQSHANDKKQNMEYGNF